MRLWARSACSLASHARSARGCSGEAALPRHPAPHSATEASRSLGGSEHYEPRQRGHARSRVAASAPGATLGPLADIGGEDRGEDRLELTLDKPPTLTPLTEVYCVLLPLLAAAGLFAATGRWHGNTLAAKLVAALLAGLAVSLAVSPNPQQQDRSISVTLEPCPCC
jgi:hypothetical protein